MWGTCISRGCFCIAVQSVVCGNWRESTNIKWVRHLGMLAAVIVGQLLVSKDFLVDACKHVRRSANQGGFWFCCGLRSVLNPLHNTGGKMLYLMDMIWEKYCILKGVTGAICFFKCLQVTRCLYNATSHFSSPPFAGRKMSLCDPADGPVLVHRGPALGCDSSAAHRPLSLPGDPPI